MRRCPTAWSVAVNNLADSSLTLRGTVPVAARMPTAMRTPQLLLACLVFLACAPTGVDNTDLVEVTVRLKLAGDRDVGATPGRVWVFIDSQPVARALAFPDFGEPCVLSTTPVSTCTFSAPRSSYVSLLASEPDPAVAVRFAPKSPQDTVRDGRYVEFTGWTECPDQTERGQCSVRAREGTLIEGNFQLMQQVAVYQMGAATMDYVTFAAGPTLKVPAENINILDFAGCRRLFTAQLPDPCDSIRMMGATSYHRFSAYVPRKTIVAMFPFSGLETEFQSWDGSCIPSGIFWAGVCSVITPDTSGAAIMLTARYSWWQCGSAVTDRSSPGCELRGVEPRARTSSRR
jgi:hypothetical protein